MIEIIINPVNKKIKVPAGSLLLNVLKQAGIEITTPCGGNGNCGKCKVLISSQINNINNNLPNSNEKKWLSAEEIKDGFRLACQYILHEDSTIIIPASASIKKKDFSNVEKLKTGLLDDNFRTESSSIKKYYLNIDPPTLEDQRSDWARVKDELNRSTGFTGESWNISPHLLRNIPELLKENNYSITMAIHKDSVLAIEGGDTRGEMYGVVFDIGTTTLAGYLVDLHTYKDIASEACNNPQSIRGYDVISRIDYAKKSIANRYEMQQELVDSINKLTKLLSSKSCVNTSRIYLAAIVGNTTMHHFLWLLPTDNLGSSPFIPVITESIFQNAGDLEKFCLIPHAKLYCAPNVSAYVGGDIIADLIDVAIWEKTGNILLVDLGTNGEIVLYSDGKMLACSTAAGPAFEGAKISSGMRATVGAIDKVEISAEGVKYRVIDNVKAEGICGSGIIDLISGLLKVQLIKPDGRLVGREECPDNISPSIRERIIQGNDGNRFLIVSAKESATGKPIYLSQKDLREIQLAKGAVRAGIDVLMEFAEIEQKDIDEILLAGSFGNIVDIESALTIGLIPKISCKKIFSIGNAAGRGAIKLLLSEKMRGIAENISEEIKYIELSSQSNFTGFFMEAILFNSEIIK